MPYNFLTLKRESEARRRGPQVASLEDNNPWYEDLGIMALRTVPAVAGTLGGGALGALGFGVGAAPGAIAGGAAGGALGELLAQGYEKWDKRRESFNPTQIGVQGAIGAIPFGKGGGVAMNALKGAALGGVSAGATKWAETGEAPGVNDVAGGVLLGGALGGLTAKLAGRKPPPAPAVAPTMVRSTRRVVDELPPALVEKNRAAYFGRSADEILDQTPLKTKPGKTGAAGVHTGTAMRGDPDMAAFIGNKYYRSQELANNLIGPRSRLRALVDNGQMDEAATLAGKLYRTTPELGLAAYKKQRDVPTRFQTVGRGKVSVEQMQAGASRVTPTSLKPGEGFKSAEQLLATERRGKEIFEAWKPLEEKRLAGTDLSGIEHEQWKRLNSRMTDDILEQWGGRRETARTMRAMQVKIGDRFITIPERAVSTAMKLGLSNDDIKTLMQRHGSDEDGWRQSLGRAATAKMTGWEKFNSVITGNALSGLPTQERNIIGTATNLMMKPLLSLPAAALDAARVATGKQAHRTIYAREGLDQLAGMVGAGKTAFGRLTDVLKQGYSKGVESTGGLDLVTAELPGGGKNPYNVIKRVMEGTDLFFRTLAEGGEATARLKALPKIAASQGIEVGSKQYQALVAKALEEAQKESFRASFQGPAGKAASMVIGLKKEHPWLHPILMFVKTPSHILTQAAELTPMGFGMKRANRALVGDRIANETQARAAAGTLGMAALWTAAAAGNLSGSGPSDPAKQAALRETGWQPNSVKIGDSWVPYGVVQPLSIPAALVANAYQAWTESSESGKRPDPLEVMSNTVLETGNSILDQSFLAGIADLLDAMKDPQRAGRRWMTRVASTFVPGSAALRNVAYGMDPTIRRPETVAEGVAAGLPGLSQTVKPRLDRFGQPVQRTGSVLGRSIGAVVPSPVKSDPVAQGLAGLGRDIASAMPEKSITAGRQTYPLSSDDGFVLGQAKGQALYNLLAPMFKNRGFQSLPSEIQAQRMERVLSQARGMVQKRAALAVRSGRPLTLADLLRGLQPRP